MTTNIIPVDNPAFPGSWYKLNPVWQGGKELVQQGLTHGQLAPAWQMLILGDGSPTRHLQLLTGEPTKVDVIDMSLIGMDSDQAPEIITSIPDQESDDKCGCVLLLDKGWLMLYLGGKRIM